MRLLRLFCACLLVMLATPAAAFGQGRCNAPPGTAAVEQYCEWVPSASGDRRPRDGDGGPPVPVPPGTVRELAKSQEGRDLAEFLGHDPDAPQKAKRRRATPEKTEGIPAPPTPANNPLDAVRSAVAAGPGISDFLPGAFLAVTVIMLGWAWVSFRRRRSND